MNDFSMSCNILDNLDENKKKWCSIVFVVGPNSFNRSKGSVKVIKAVKKGD